MHDDQRVIAERLVNEVLYHGLLKNLSVNSTIGIRPQLTHTLTMADVHTESTSSSSSSVQQNLGNYDVDVL